ncbi:MAG: hypothetical protein K1Y02_14460 [Candidatus Hydrogenedentes bacterium]|nr:hypothetical protein [Candidatus Hydrogenedentota bacterium]
MKSKILKTFIACLVLTCVGVAAIWITFKTCTRTVEIAIPIAAGDHSPGALHKVEQIGTYTRSMLATLLWWGNLPDPISVEYGARLYRVQYWTRTPWGTDTIASGLVCIPKTKTPRGVVSYQHGTAVNRRLTPSAPTLLESGLGTAIFAGGGYILCAADYIGLGINTEVHPYLHAEGTATAVVDLLKAAHAFVNSRGVAWPSSLHLAGFSQGGYSTMAAHRALETLGDPRFQVVSSAPIAGPYDLAGVTFPVFLEGNDSYLSAYLAYLAHAYSTIYSQPLNSVLTDDYAKTVPGLFDGNQDEWVVAQRLPSQPRAMFRKEFLDAFDRGESTWFTTALAQNQVLQWSPKAPVRLYYSEHDPVVSPREAITAFSELKKRGCDITLIQAGEADHAGTALFAVPKIRQWFDEKASKRGG